MNAHSHGQVVGYVRVSTTDQRTDRQIAALGPVDKLFTDHVSGRSREARPALADAMAWVRSGDELRVASMDRLARSLVDLEQIVDELTRQDVAVRFLKENLLFAGSDTPDPFAVFQRQLIGAVAQLERSLIRERQREGIELAKIRGAYQGRKPSLTPDQATVIRSLASQGVPKTRLATQFGCSRRTIHSVIHGEGVYRFQNGETTVAIRQ